MSERVLFPKVIQEIIISFLTLNDRLLLSLPENTVCLVDFDDQAGCGFFHIVKEEKIRLYLFRSGEVMHQYARGHGATWHGATWSMSWGVLDMISALKCQGWCDCRLLSLGAWVLAHLNLFGSLA
jgi:hypothetical protein